MSEPPPSLDHHLLQTQWVSTTLKHLEVAAKKHGSPLSVQDSYVTSLLEGGLGSSSSFVSSTCMVLCTAAGVRCGWIDHQELLSSLTKHAASASIYGPIIGGVACLLLQEMESIVESCSVYISPYSIRTSVHPFISILNSRPSEVGQLIVDHVIEILTDHHLSRSSLLFVEVVIKYILINPDHTPIFFSLAVQLHSDLIHLAMSNREDSAHLVELMSRVLPLQPTDTNSQLLFVVACSCHLTSLLTTPTSEGLLDYFFVLAIELTERSLSIKRLLGAIATLLKGATPCGHQVLAISWLLDHQHTSPPTLALLLALVSSLALPLTTPHLSPLLVFPLVQILSAPTSFLLSLDHHHLHLTNQREAKILLDGIEGSCRGRGRCPDVPLLGGRPGAGGLLASMYTSVRAYFSVMRDTSASEAWLEALSETPPFSGEVCDHLAILVAALAYSLGESGGVLHKTTRAFHNLVKASPKLAPSVFTFLLHLNTSILDPESKLKLFHFIPKLAAHYPEGVVNTLRVLGCEPSLLPLATCLMGKAWLYQDHLYPHVRELLTRPLPPSFFPPNTLREVQVARSAVIRDICLTRPEQHGEDMLALVSRILTSAFQDTLQVAMAMEGVVNLCLHEVVDVVTAWSVLGRVDKLASDTRPAVVVGICSMFALAAELDEETSHAHKRFKQSGLEYLWRNAFSRNSTVSTAALKSLTHFKLEDHFSHYIPSHLPRSQSHDPGSAPLLLAGSQCVHMVHHISRGALDAYSAFLASLLDGELASLPRGVVYSALQQAKVLLPHEAVLANTNLVKCSRQGVGKYAALLRINGPPFDLGVQSAARRRELTQHLEENMVTLNDLLERGVPDRLLELDGPTLWEGVACLYSSKWWGRVRKICQVYYQIGLVAGGPPDQPQAYNWKNISSAAFVFMAIVGVASFECDISDQSACSERAVVIQESLLTDLIKASMFQLGGDGHVTYTHDVIAMIMEGDHPKLAQAVVTSMPHLFAAATSYWGHTPPTHVLDSLVQLASNLFGVFNSGPNWYTSIVLSQLFTTYLPLYHQLETIFDKLLPFLEVSIQGTNVELLSLTGPFIAAVLLRGNQGLALDMFLALQNILVAMETDLLSSHPAQLCALHLASGLTDLFAAGLVAGDVAMTTVGHLADMSAKPSQGVWLHQFSLGIALCGLSGCGHPRAHSLAEKVASRWLQELTALSEGKELIPVMMGLAGLVGVDPIKGGAWEFKCKMTQHEEMMKILSSLLVSGMEKLTSHDDSSVASLAEWIRSLVATERTELMTLEERVPLDYSYLPSSSLLHSIVQLCQALLVHCRDDHTHIYILNCLLSLLSLHKSQLPPANFSSLFLPVLCGRGFGAELQQACIRCFTRNKKVQGFRGLGQYLTHPSVFPCLPKDSQVTLLESLPLVSDADKEHHNHFLVTVSKMLLADIYNHRCLLTAFLRGMELVLTSDTSEERGGVIRASTLASLRLIYKRLCGLVGQHLSHTSTQGEVLRYLYGNDNTLWKQLALCVQHAPPDLVHFDPKEPVMEGVAHVGVAVQCSQTVKKFSTLTDSVQWILTALKDVEDVDDAVPVILSPLHLILHTITMCAASNGNQLLLYKTELLRLMRSWTRDNQPMNETQWKCLLLFAVSGCGLNVVGSPDHVIAMATGLKLSSTLDSSLISGLPEQPLVREKLCQCLMEWISTTDNDVIRNHILGYLTAFKSSEEYKKGIIWSTIAHIL